MPWEVARLGIFFDWALSNAATDAAFEVEMWILRCSNGPPSSDDHSDPLASIASFSNFMITYTALEAERLIVVRSVIGPT